MSTTPSKNPSTSTNKNSVEPAKPADPKSVPDTKPAEPATTETHAAPAGSDGVKSDTKTIVSITVSSRLASKARLLARIRGVTISSLFTDSAAKSIPAALKVALDEMKDEDLE